MPSLTLGKVHSFNTRAPGILGTSIKNAKLLAILDFSTAMSFDNLVIKYRSIYPLLPVGSPSDPDLCTYYLFLSESGEKIVFADAWIDTSTVEIIEHINFTVTFTEASLDDIAKVRMGLAALGYTNFTTRQL